MSYFTPQTGEAKQGQVVKVTVAKRAFKCSPQALRNRHTTLANNLVSPQTHTYTQPHTNTRKTLKMFVKTDFAIKTLACAPLEAEGFQHAQSKQQSVCFKKRQTMAYPPSEITQCKTNAPQLHTIN